MMSAAGLMSFTWVEDSPRQRMCCLLGEVEPRYEAAGVRNHRRCAGSDSGVSRVRTQAPGVAAGHTELGSERHVSRAWARCLRMESLRTAKPFSRQYAPVVS